MIPEAAVEAAAHALFEKELGRPMEVADEGLYAEDIGACREDARAALEAAAPHMLGMGAVSAVLALHREQPCVDEGGDPVGGSYCEECKDLDDHTGERVHEIYPCLTVREITASLAGAETFTAMRDWIERTTK